MATNKSMVGLLERQVELVDELAAINRIIREHIKAQKRQKGQDFKDEYRYDKSRKCYTRIYS